MPSATKPAKRTKAKAAAKNGADYKPGQKSRPAAGVALELPVAEIRSSPDNPRTHFDADELKALGESMKDHGQIQEVVLWRPAAGGYELIDGERRWRAAKRAKLGTLRAIVMDVTEEEAIELRGLANWERRQFNAFETARFIQQLAERCGHSQRAIAAKLHISQAQVSQMVGLLKLPEEWEQRVAAGELDATHLRHLTPWALRANVMEAAAVAFKEWVANAAAQAEREGKPPERITVEQFQYEVLANAANEHSRPVDRYHGGCEFNVTAELEAELDVQEVPDKWGRRRRAFNVTRWEELQAEGREKRKKREKANLEKLNKELNGSAGGKGAGKGAKAKKGKAAAAEAEEPDGPEPGRLADLWMVWYRYALAERLSSEKLTKRDQRAAVRLLLALDLADAMTGEIAEVISDTLRQEGDIARYDLAKRVWSLGDDGLQERAAALCAAVLRDDDAWQWAEDAECDLVWLAAPWFGVDWAREWKPGSEWLELLSRRQLRGLLPGYLLAECDEQRWGKTELVERLLKDWPAAGGVPEELRDPGRECAK